MWNAGWDDFFNVPIQNYDTDRGGGSLETRDIHTQAIRKAFYYADQVHQLYTAISACGLKLLVYEALSSSLC